MFWLFKMPNRRTFGHFLASSENKLLFVKKEDMSSKRKTYGKPIFNSQLKLNGRLPSEALQIIGQTLSANQSVCEFFYFL